MRMMGISVFFCSVESLPVVGNEKKYVFFLLLFCASKAKSRKRKVPWCFCSGLGPIPFRGPLWVSTTALSIHFPYLPMHLPHTSRAASLKNTSSHILIPKKCTCHTLPRCMASGKDPNKSPPFQLKKLWACRHGLWDPSNIMDMRRLDGRFFRWPDLIMEFSWW